MGTPAALQASDDPYLRQFLKGEEQGPVAFHYPATDIAQAFCLGETHRGH
jgi:phospholipid/cholesterol/gamma-HCH transport system ATP-binding protein